MFSFGAVLYELMTREVTSAVVIQSGDPQMPELYAFKVMQQAVPVMVATGCLRSSAWTHVMGCLQPRQAVGLLPGCQTGLQLQQQCKATCNVCHDQSAAQASSQAAARMSDWAAAARLCTTTCNVCHGQSAAQASCQAALQELTAGCSLKCTAMQPLVHAMDPYPSARLPSTIQSRLQLHR